MTVEATGPDGSIVHFQPPPRAVAGTTPVPVTCRPSSGSRFRIGRTRVECSARASSGPTSRGSFAVTVRDSTPPVLTVPAGITVQGGPHAASHQPIAAFLRRAVATDLVTRRPTISHNAPRVFPLGQTVVTFTARDGAGNRSSRSSTVTLARLAAAGTAPPAAPPAAAPQQPAAADRTPPGDVRNVRTRVGNRLVSLRWMPPADGDFARVLITRSRNGGAERAVYQGAGRRFRDRKVRNGIPYRYLLISFDRAGNRSAGVARVVLPKALMLFAPRVGATVRRPPLLAWRPVRGARYYNVQLFRGSRKVLSAWPSRSRLRLRSAWRYDGRRRSLAAGRYRWYVWPGLGPRSRARYGPLLGQSSFVVRARRT